MTIRNPWNAPGNQNIDSFRRAVGNAFSTLVTSLNSNNRPRTGGVLPTATSRIPPVVGDTFYLTTTDNTNMPGFYGWNGTSWERLSN